MEKHVMQYQTVHFNLNGKDVERTVDVRASLTDMLRNDFRMTSVKKGCEVGECGACNVLIDGEAFNSCIYLAVWAEGKHIRTLEGLLGPNGELSDIQQAFVDEAAIQCGFCTPGFILTAVEILESGKEYTDDELRKLLSGHLCRCTGYENILRAVKKTMYKRLGKPMPEAWRSSKATRPRTAAGLLFGGCAAERFSFPGNCVILAPDEKGEGMPWPARPIRRRTGPGCGRLCWTRGWRWP